MQILTIETRTRVIFGFSVLRIAYKWGLLVMLTVTCWLETLMLYLFQGSDLVLRQAYCDMLAGYPVLQRRCVRLWTFRPSSLCQPADADRKHLVRSKEEGQTGWHFNCRREVHPRAWIWWVWKAHSQGMSSNSVNLTVFWLLCHELKSYKLSWVVTWLVKRKDNRIMIEFVLFCRSIGLEGTMVAQSLMRDTDIRPCFSVLCSVA